MSKYSIIFILFVFQLPQMAVCQSNQLQLIDQLSGKSIENAHIHYNDKHAITDSYGKAKLVINAKTRISISHISYRDTSFFIGQMHQDVLIKLQPKINTLPEMQVNAKPTRLFAPEKTHVFDFEFWSDSLLVLTYSKEKLFRRGTDQSEAQYIGCKLLLISPRGSVIDSLPLPDLVKGFYKDPLKNVFILSGSTIVLIKSKKGKLSLSKIDLNEFHDFIEPLSGNSNSTYFFNDYQWDYPEFSYYALDKVSKKRYLVRTIRDKFTMELFRAEYKYLSRPAQLKAARLEDKTGIDREIFGAYMSGFTQHPYYQNLYAPLFNYGDSVLIFDHHSNRIYLYNSIGIKLDSTEIHYHENRSSKFKNEIITDEEQKTFYGIFEKSGVKNLRKINPISGESREIVNLYYAYPEKIKVRNHKVYYIYRKTGGSNTKHLFVEGI